MCATTLVILAAFLVLPGRSLLADPGRESGPDVVALIVPLNAGAEVFGPVVASALEARFDPAGLLLDVRTLRVPGSGEQDSDALIRQAETTAAGAVLICRFSVVNRKMTAEMDWQDVPEGAHAEVSDGAPVNLSLDSFILRVLDALVARVQDRVDEMAARRREAAAAADEAAAEATALAEAAAKAASAASAEAATVKTAPETKPAAPPPDPPRVASVRPTVEDDTSTRRFLLSTGIAPFIPVGADSSYFSLGYTSAAALNFVFPVSSGRIAAGISLGVVSFTAQGAPGTSTTFLVPLGLDASYLLRGGSMAGFLFHLTGGAAVLFVSSPTLGTKAKTVPFLRGAVGLELQFSRTVGVLLDAGYEVYFEMPLLIMGVSPALEIRLGL